jgi:hypothetical protein
MRLKVKALCILLLVITLFSIKNFIEHESIRLHESIAPTDNIIVDPLVSNGSSMVVNNRNIKVYQDLNVCTVNYETANRASEQSGSYNYALAADESLHSETIVRGLLFYFETKSADHFMPEFKWVFRSWLEMLKTSPNQWHTDLIVFINMDHLKFYPVLQTFEELGCLIGNPRQTKTEKSMCILIDFKSMKDRAVYDVYDEPEQLYKHLYNDLDVFSDDPNNLKKFYGVLKDLNHYGYTDSILVAFESYKYVKDLYDFLVRTDLDIFITPKFGKWLPRHCNDFIVGNGGYSTAFNTRRLGRIAANLGLNYESKTGLGSTWYSTPRQFRIVSYFTLVSMVYISNYEFTEPERKSQIGTLNWPEWHYGVLLLYGQHVAVNHLSSKRINFVKLQEHFDVPSSADISIDAVLQIHTCNFYILFFDRLFVRCKTTNSLHLNRSWCRFILQMAV